MMMVGDAKESLKRTDGPLDFGSEVPMMDLAKQPKNVLRRVRALKKLQMEEIGVLSSYYKAVHELDTQYEKQYNGIRKKRNAIVNGQREPNDDECKAPLLHTVSPEELKHVEDSAPEADAETKGIPDFWLTVLMNSTDVNIFFCDVPLLKHLTDVTCELHSDPAGYTLSFHFSENDYITNTVLKKHYELSMEPDFDFDGTVLVSCRNEKVNWRDGKDLTKLVSEESFFSFFNCTDGAKLTDDLDEEKQNALVDDFETAEAFRQKIIPRAVLYYTDEVDQSDNASDDSGSEGSGASSGSDGSSGDEMES